MLFEGDRSAAEAYLESVAGRYYVYVLCRPDRQPFYVGKGINKRALEHEAEARRNHPIGESNPFKCNVIRKIVRAGGNIIYRIDAVFDPACQQDCLDREASLIAHRAERRHVNECWLSGSASRRLNARDKAQSRQR